MRDAVLRVPWAALAITIGLVPILVVWCFASEIPAMLVLELNNVVLILDYKRADDGTELLYTNATTDVVGLSRRRPGGEWLLCWTAYDDPPFDGEIALSPNGTTAIVRRERLADLDRDGRPSQQRIFDWSKDDKHFCGGSGAFANSNPIRNDHGTRVAP